MKFSNAAIVALGLIATLPTPAIAAPAQRHSFAATCTGPVTPRDSAASLLRRFAPHARRETLPGAEGDTFPGVVLYPRDPQRRIEVAFADDRMTRVSTVILRGTRSVWSVAGMALGDGVPQITSSNGRAFTLSGFEWDMGGYVTDLRGGALARLPGGCTLSIRFSPPPTARSTPEALMGDVAIQSTSPALRRLAPTVTELSLVWP